ncbi:hypothetical protein VUR80DRAFT_8930 [Thermomyces stellatus]
MRQHLGGGARLDQAVQLLNARGEGLPDEAQADAEPPPAVNGEVAPEYLDLAPSAHKKFELRVPQGHREPSLGAGVEARHDGLAVVELNQVRLHVELGVDSFLGGVLHLGPRLHDSVRAGEGGLVAAVAAACGGDLGDLLQARHIISGTALDEAHEAVRVVLLRAGDLGHFSMGS